MKKSAPPASTPNASVDDQHGNGPTLPAPEATPAPAPVGSARREQGRKIRILTNFPQQLPVLPAEIALIETYWAAFSQLNAGNDNQDLV